MPKCKGIKILKCGFCALFIKSKIGNYFSFLPYGSAFFFFSQMIEYDLELYLADKTHFWYV